MHLRSVIPKLLGRVNIRLQNLTCRLLVIKPQTTITAISAACVVPPMLVPKVTIKSASAESSDSALLEIKSDFDQSFSRARLNLSLEQSEKLFSKVEVHGIANWCEQEQKEVKDLTTEFGFL